MSIHFSIPSRKAHKFVFLRKSDCILYRLPTWKIWPYEAKYNEANPKFAEKFQQYLVDPNSQSGSHILSQK